MPLFSECGNASEGILKTITSKEVDLAILGTNALHGFERLVFGSTAEAVLRKAVCPVLTVGPQASDAAMAGQTDGPVVLATDFHLKTTSAIRDAAFFCKATRAPLHCLHVLPRTLEGGDSNHILPQIVTEALQQVAIESGTTIDPPVCAVTYGSEISNAVVQYAKQQKAKLIVLGVRQAFDSGHASPCPHRISHQNGGAMSRAYRSLHIQTACNARSRLFLNRVPEPTQLFASDLQDVTAITDARTQKNNNLHWRRLCPSNLPRL